MAHHFVDEVLKRGYQLGLQAVLQNCTDLIDPSWTAAFEIALSWATANKQQVFQKVVDGADPEYLELLRAFEREIEDGIHNVLDMLRDGV